MSDSAKQKVLAVYPDAACMNSATGEKSIWSTNNFNTCEPLSTEIPEAVIRFFRTEEAAWDDAASKLPAPPAPQGSGEHKLVADSPTFAYSLAMFLTRNGQRGNAPEMQEEIEMFMRDSRQSTTLKS